MIQLGITGGIGSGKSIVSSVLARCGIPVYYADDRAKALYADSRIRTAVELVLGPVYDGDGQIDRKKLAALIFSDPIKRQKLEAIIHPAVADDYRNWVTDNTAARIVAKEAALLIEAGTYKLLDYLILVTAPHDVKLQRIAARDGIATEEIFRKIAAQLSDDEKAPFADFLIINDGLAAILPQLDSILKSLGISVPIKP